MTMEELAEEWIKQNCCECCVNKDDCDAGTIDCFAKQAFLAGYETLEKENAELNDKLNNLSSVAEVRLANWQKYADAYNETQELLDKQIEATYKVVEENTKLRKDLEELTITNNYQKVISDKNEQISFLETRLAEAKSLINRLSEYIVLSEDYWKKEDVERQKEILREVEKFLKE